MGLVDYMKTKKYQWDLSTAIYMLEPWEKMLFSTQSPLALRERRADHRSPGADVVFVLLLCLWGYSTFTIFPTYFRATVSLLERAVPGLTAGVPFLQAARP